MTVRFCRLTKARYQFTAFGGEGARLYPGRWNHKGVPLVYCAATLSLAALEYFVHIDAPDLPDDLVALPAELPDDAVEVLDAAVLPRDWRALPGPSALKDIGDAWVRSMRTVGLSVPSAVVPSERNVLLNPAHSGMAALHVGPAEPFAFDARIRRLA